MVRKQFSIEEAERLLPTISPLVEQVQEFKERIESYEQVSLRKRIMTDGSEEFPELEETILDSEFHELQEAFYSTVDKLEHTGCILRDVDAGLVDFTTNFEGREVFLSWRLGERGIAHWHETDEDATGRKRILELR